jgi:hypothetical protein
MKDRLLAFLLTAALAVLLVSVLRRCSTSRCSG